MKGKTWALVGILTAAIAGGGWRGGLDSSAGRTLTSGPADLVVKNARIFTGTERLPGILALAAQDGRIVALGAEEEVVRFIGPSTRVLDVKGRLVVPGFIDAHCHFSYGGNSLAMLDLGDALTMDFLKKKLAERISELPEGAAVFGFASFPNPGLFGGLGWPTKEILDEVSPGNPVVIRRRGGHAVWINSLALEISGISGDSVAPEGGEILKDAETGEPTGILKEAAAGLLRVREISDPRADIERALDHAAALGLTGIHTGSHLKEIEIFRSLEAEGKLTLRVYAWLPIEGLDEYIRLGIRQGNGDEMVKVGFLKVFIDGTIGVRSALMFEPFAEEPGNSGLAQYREEDFYALVEKAHQHGFQVGVHAIGDKAVHWTLNAFERAQKAQGAKGLRHRIEHNTVNILTDTERFAPLGVVASMQPNITGSELYRRTRLGEERARRVDMWKTLLDRGAILAWGTDWPVSSLNPMFNLFQLVTRTYPEERLTMAEALKFYSWGPAYASHEEDIKGTLEVGKLADMTILSRDLFDIPAREISRTEVLVTVLGGRIVYENPIMEKE